MLHRPHAENYGTRSVSLFMVNLFLSVIWLRNGRKSCIRVDIITLCIIHTRLNYCSLIIRLTYVTGYALEEEREYYSVKRAVIQWPQWQSIDFSSEQIGICSTVFVVKDFPLLPRCMATKKMIGNTICKLLLEFTSCELGFTLFLSLYQSLWKLLSMGNRYVTSNLHITREH